MGGGFFGTTHRHFQKFKSMFTFLCGGREPHDRGLSVLLGGETLQISPNLDYDGVFFGGGCDQKSRTKTANFRNQKKLSSSRSTTSHLRVLRARYVGIDSAGGS